MDPQKRFLASTIQGAMDAEVVTVDDLYRHMSAKVLAEHVPAEILWAVLTQGMQKYGLGFRGAGGGSAYSSSMPLPIPSAEPEPAPAPTPVPVPNTSAAGAASEKAGGSNFPGNEVDVEADLDAMFDEVTDGAASESTDLPFVVEEDGDMLEIDSDEALVVEDFDLDDES